MNVEAPERALQAARRALGSLDPDQVPADLHRVARYQGGRLPPPLRNRLSAALEEYPWLRDKALEEWTATGDEDDPQNRAGYVYLKRPQGWEEELEAFRARVAGRDAERAGRRLTAESAALRRQLTEMKERLAAARHEVEGLHADIRQASRDAAARWKRRVHLAERSAAEASSSAALAETEVRRLRALLDEAAEDNRTLVHRIRLERSKRAELEAEMAGRAAGSASLGGAQLAGHLDHLARLGSPAVSQGAAEAETAFHPAVKLPHGTRPDEAAAVDALLSRSEPWHLVVDGYNVAFRFDGGALGELRRRLHAGLGRIARRGGRRLTVTVVWDAAGGESRRERVDGVNVLYVADVIADDAIVESAHAATVPMVVATDDRMLRERVEEAGAVTIWAAAVVDWLQHR